MKNYNMPQDSLRSVVYRSFVTCDNPKGVVECNTTIRKSKTHPHKLEHNIKSHNDSSTSSSSYHEERRDKKVSKDELQNLSSSQMMEVSRGAHKLNEVIDSLSNGNNHSKYIAKDLLKGALDLQQSLAMLGKLQDASSQYINAKSKKKQKNKPVEGRVDEFTDSYPIRDYYNQEMDYQKPRISVDGSSRDCYDELREVIRESFARQNLLPKVSPNEKALVDRKSVDLCIDVGSTSSSQSSLIFSHSSECSPSHVKPKRPNLIAKLMGLEEVPSKAVNSVRYKWIEKEKVPNQRRDLLDIDLPRPRSPRFRVQKVGRERRTLEEMIETMQFKGLLERKHVDGSNYDKDVEERPIVIMKPLHVQHLRHEELHPNYYVDEEKHVKSIQFPRKMREKVQLNATDVPRGHLKFNKIEEKLPVRRTPKQKLNKDRVVKKNLDIHESLSLTKINHSKNPSPKEQKKETTVKKIDKTPKEVSETRKKAEVKATKSQESTRTEDVGKATTLKLSNSTRGSNVSKSPIPRGKTSERDKHVISTSLKSSIPKKNLKKDKPDRTPSAALVVNIQYDNNLPLNLGSDIQGLAMKATTSEQITGEVMDASSNPISDISESATCSPSEPSGPTIKDDIKYVEDGSCIPCNIDEMNGCKSITNTKYILLSNASFLNRVEKLYNIETCDPTAFPTACEVLDDCLILECGKEILERKSICCTRTIFPLPQEIFKKPKYYLSLEQLVGEISDGIESLRSYSEYCGDITRVDSIYAMLERDLRWKGEATSAWDSGWYNELGMEEVNVVMNDVEKLVLSEIVDDLIIELLF